jgi:hypothetical protein
MKRWIGVSAVSSGVVGVMVLCCCSGMIGESRRGVQEAREARERASEDLGQVEGQTGTEETATARPRVPAWQDVSRVAGPEAGDAEGLTYERILALRHAIHVADGDDAAATVARAEGLSEDVVWDAMVTAAELQEDVARVVSDGRLRSGLVGGVEVQGVADDPELGPLTVLVVLTVNGCPRATDLAFLAETASGVVAHNLPSGIDGYRGVIEYEGLRCERGRYGSVVFDAETGRVDIGR